MIDTKFFLFAVTGALHRMRRHIIAGLIAVLFLVQPCVCQETLVLEGEGSWDINAVSSISQKARYTTIGDFAADSLGFVPVKNSKMNFGLSTDQFCFRFMLQQKQKDPIRYSLQVNFPVLDSISLYEEVDGELVLLGVVGDQTRDENQEKAYYHTLPVLLTDSLPHSYFLNIQPVYNATFPVRLYTQDARDRYVLQDVVKFGFFLGFMLVITLFTLILYVRLKERIYLYYAVFTWCSFLFAFFRNRLDLVFYPEGELLHAVPHISMLFLTQVFFALSSLGFLEVKSFAPRLITPIRLIIGFLISLFAMSLLVREVWVVQLSVLVSIFDNGLMLLMGIYIWRRGNHIARNYLIGLSALCGSIILYSLSTSGLIGNEFLDFNYLRAGVMLEMLFLTYIIVERYSHTIATLQIEKNERTRQQARAQKLGDELEQTGKELFSTAMEVAQKREVIEQIKAGLESTDGLAGSEELLRKVLRSDNQKERDWNQFREYFEKVHTGFLSLLLNRYPALTTHDLRICAYIKINLSTKEIASLLNVKPTSVQVMRHRLKKKLQLDKDTDLIRFIQNYS
ncbi:hypothetical protein BGP76_17590 [Reichenbachiella sp. MSK19-1]|nr:hypothetical protein BGP76_17590 [Reichenbachiella sp. MSK19-1]